MPLISVISSLIGQKALEYFVEKSLDSGRKFINDRKETHSLSYNENNLTKIFNNHYVEVTNWAADIPFIGLSQNKQVNDSTIQLSISTRISKFGKDKNEKFLNELELINSRNNTLLLGKPGSGKTTTIKRLINKFFSDASDKVEFTNPVLIRLRELDSSSSIYFAILDIFGFSYESRIIRTEKTKINADGTEDKYPTSIKKYYIKDSDLLIEPFVADFLNDTKSILFLDGFDELLPTAQKKILGDITQLGLKLNNAKIILTSRTSTLNNKILDGFDTYEIHPITIDDVSIIAEKWLGEHHQRFVTELLKKPYHELANRPIFLTLLLILFEKQEVLPISPYEVYREAVYLIIRDWDEHRSINRVSKYSGFNVRKKLDFLQEFAFYITYQIKANVFSTNKLSEIYKLIHERYDLPLDEMADVISEIESHNGLIAEIGYRTFEFSHLTLQEYLCAEYIVTLPYSQNIIEYFFARPDPLAIAVCLSRDSGLWLATMLLHESLNIKAFIKDDYSNALNKFLTRLIDEYPLFNKSFELGCAMIYLIHYYNKDNAIFEVIIKLLGLPNVSESLSMTLPKYNINEDEIGKRCKMRRTQPIPVTAFITPLLDVEITLEKWNIVKSIL
ncbi:MULTISPECIES: NACHT domain-containing protein [Xanthocytophaga]|uniref:NACHT domain-containing protein n=2 Tax=Xanthocytophaga TaxID=3078918 RepID=A0AAE3UAV0_9BACT|nr:MULTISPECIES: NACHT domain-containing protein [Xanthocytophaga]MDJ1483094.1 NACHT domain-containing protein [Xanthocytophaga flavus]MDJ1503635.1 NACHT domain-containing protein [Xanthocytophaga agilis]